MGKRRIAIACFLGVIASFAACLDFGSLTGSVAADAGPDARADAGVLDASSEAAVVYVPPASCHQAGYACIAAASAGWTGPFALYDGHPASEPACPSKFPNAVVDKIYADPSATTAAVCSTCTCGGSNGTCATSVALMTGSCGNLCSTVVLPDATCTLVGGGAVLGGGCGTFTPPTSMIFTAGETDAGSCPPSPQAPTSSPVSWATTARGCSPPSVEPIDCAAGSVCLAIPDPPFHSSGCISHEGDLACPSDGPYTDKRVFYGGDDDTRTCSACACTSPQGGACDITLGRFSDPACKTATAKLREAPPGQCLAYATSDGTYFSVDAFVDGGTCTPSGGKASGTISPKAPTTICCTP